MTQERKQFQRTEDGHLILLSNEERNLLITDLTSRINYGVICLIERVDDFGPIHRNEKLTGFCFDDRGGFYFEVSGGLGIDFAEKIMPYLRPMSSMTEEEEGEYWNIVNLKSPEIPVGEIPSIEDIAQCSTVVLDWLLSKGFDVRGLIPKGLALEAPEGMYVIK